MKAHCQNCGKGLSELRKSLFKLGPLSIGGGMDDYAFCGSCKIVWKITWQLERIQNPVTVKQG